MATFVTADGAELAYDVDGQGPPLLCLPGGPGRDPVYLEGLGGLTERRQLIVLHPRGAGRSPRSPDAADYAADRLAKDALELAAHVGIDHVDLLGHSAGAFAAVLATRDDPSRMGHLILVTPTRMLAPGVPDDTEEILAARFSEPWYDEIQQVLSSANPETAADMVSVVSSVAPAFYGGWDAARQTHADGQRDQMDLDTMERAPDPPALGKIPVLADVPALVITGAHDAASGVAIGDPIAGYFARGRHVTMPASGHYPWIDEPQQFVSLIESFLDAS